MTNTPQDQSGQGEKVREFWLDLDVDYYYDKPHQYSKKGFIHVIEKAAFDALQARVEELKEVYGWAQAVLTALNVGDVQKESLLHKKLREVLIQYRETLAKTEGGE